MWSVCSHTLPKAISEYESFAVAGCCKGDKLIVREGKAGECCDCTDLKDPFKLLLTGTPFHFGQMEVPDERPGIRVLIVDLQGFFEPIRRLVNLPFVSSDASEAEVTVDVVWMVCKSMFL